MTWPQGADVSIALLAGNLAAKRTTANLVRGKPMPFASEPLAHTDAAGRRKNWSGSVGRFGLGFSS